MCVCVCIQRYWGELCKPLLLFLGLTKHHTHILLGWLTVTDWCIVINGLSSGPTDEKATYRFLAIFPVFSSFPQSIFHPSSHCPVLEEADLVHNLVSDLVLKPGFKRPGFCVLSNSIPSGILQWEIEGMEEGMELLSGLLPEKYLRIIMLLGQRLLLLSRQSSLQVSLLYVWRLFLSFMTSGSWSDNISSITRPRLLYIP